MSSYMFTIKRWNNKLNKQNFQHINKKTTRAQQQLEHLQEARLTRNQMEDKELQKEAAKLAKAKYFFHL